MLLKISHTTNYAYDGPMAYALQQLRLTPKPSAGQRVIGWETHIEGGHKELSYRDQHDNLVELAGVDPDRTELIITARGDVETTDTAGVVREEGGFAPLWYFARQTELTRPGAGVRKLIRGLAGGSGDTIPALHDLSRRVADTVTYETGRTGTEMPAEEVLELGHGVCQDQAHVFIAAARLMELPARYVSGYLMLDDRVEQEATHAWAEVHVDGTGWIGFDVSNGISPDERYVRLATGLDYHEAAPVRGVRRSDARESMLVAVCVEQ